MNRRKFIQYGALGSTAFIINLGLLNPKKADAFLFALLGGALLDSAFSLLLSGAFNLALRVWGRRSQEWWDSRLEMQLAQSEFLANSFTDVNSEFLAHDFTYVNLVEVNSPAYSYVLGSSKIEQLGESVAFGFLQTVNSRPSMAAYAGPASLGMAVAAQYIKDQERLSPIQIQNAILPKYQDSNSWDSWSQSFASTTYVTQAHNNGVEIIYRMIQPGRNGYGEIDVIVHAHRLIQIPKIRVNYAV